MSSRVALLVALLSSVAPLGAEAQVFLEDDARLDEDEVVRSAWVVELKVGPYLPEIDEEDGLVRIGEDNEGPYQHMFTGSRSAMPVLEVDRFFLWPYGQLGLGLAIGWMQDTARAYTLTDTGEPDTSSRSPADDTSFHLIPLSLLIVYRFTELADRTVVPLVPYVKAGLAYDIWWITKGDGSVARIGECEEASCKALGGIFGWQATAGLSLRADFLDPEASQNMSADYGVEHVGFFAEVTRADVSGFGSKNRLHVGDFTWFAGVNFEF